MSKEQSKW